MQLDFLLDGTVVAVMVTICKPGVREDESVDTTSKVPSVGEKVARMESVQRAGSVDDEHE